MKKQMKQVTASVLLVPAIVLAAVLAVAPVGALGIDDGAGAAKGADQKTDLPTTFTAITDTLLFLIGAVAVVMIVVGGIRYTISNGDSSAITGAKNTILYAVIGLVVAILAYAIVHFVVGSF